MSFSFNSYGKLGILSPRILHPVGQPVHQKVNMSAQNLKKRNSLIAPNINTPLSQNLKNRVFISFFSEKTKP